MMAGVSAVGRFHAVHIGAERCRVSLSCVERIDGRREDFLSVSHVSYVGVAYVFFYLNVDGAGVWRGA